MTKKLKPYQTPVVTVVAMGAGNIICASTLRVLLTTDIMNSGSGNPLEDMDYNKVVDEDF